MKRRVVAGCLAVALGLALTGCGSGGFSGLYDAPLPGGADLGDHPYRLKIRFADVLDLVPQAAVKVNDVPVGRVENIGFAPDGWTAEVTVAINGDVRLPADAGAMLVQSSLLGEKYVSLSSPQTPEPATLADGAVIPLERTNRNPEVEEVLGALSMLLNGGGVEQVRTISREVNDALAGKETDVRALLANVDKLTGDLAAQRGDITKAIDGLNRLSATLVSQNDNLANVLDNLEPGLRVLADQRGDLVGMLQSLDGLSGVAVDTLHRSQDDLVADLRSLQPTLRKLTEAGDRLPRALDTLLTFPFTSQSRQAIRGDYTNLDVKLDLNLDSLLTNLFLNPAQPPVALPGVGNPAPAETVPLPLPPSSSAAPATGPSGLTGLLDSVLGGA
ncbi:MCE family protein [Amycolatopsis acidiphila]|uniref:MCE family protein n=1 Tax=Amycolatopsis acidiphila TaxID=715473 RepID=A0A558AL41_9PSEU|nr:MCE family protein [Amycolatopsis acidiphila]TVT24982.1 MCE family protein [Amycolatopsis acidiphila]UIJ57512.1 MCE family protein [Amycolatopsis acidiphila]GHG96507.1 ABC transporter substrate-binding protein [Amycolatopsis acidiphila]